MPQETESTSTRKSKEGDISAQLIQVLERTLWSYVLHWKICGRNKERRFYLKKAYCKNEFNFFTGNFEF